MLNLKKGGETVARYKKIYRNQERERYKKYKIIFTIAEVSWGVLTVIGLLIGGIFQHNDTVVGGVGIFIGIVSVALVLLMLKLYDIGWAPLPNILANSEHYWRNQAFYNDRYEEDIEDTKSVWIIMMIILAVFAIAVLVAGIFKLLH